MPGAACTKLDTMT